MPKNNNIDSHNPLGHNINFSDAPNVDSGLGGYLIGNAARNEFSNKFWDNQNGYLKTITNELDLMLKQYEQMSKYEDKMSAATKRLVKERAQQLKQESEVLKNIQKQQDISADSASEIIKNATSMLTKAQEGVNKGWNDLQNKVNDAADKVKESSSYYFKLKDDFAKMNKEMGNLINTANKASDNLATSLSTTLSKAGDKLANLSNMFSLNKIASNTAEQNARSIEKIQSDTMKQFGFSSNSQFYNFADSLNNNIKEMNSSMGWLFNNQDLKNYLGNLSQFGVSDVNMAQQQMKNSVLATKYLGVSNETQTMIFKYMKRTNNNDILEKHNQTIVGLLKSELGVSKEQLDALSQIAYGSVEDKSAIGMTDSAIKAQTSAMEISGAVLSNMYGDEASKKIMDSLNDFLLNPGSASWASVFGGQYQNIYNSLYSNKTQEGQLKAIQQFLRGISNSNIVGINNGTGGGLGNALANQQLNGISSLDSAVIATLKGYNENEYAEKEAQALAGVLSSNSQEAVDRFIEQSTEATWLEKIENLLSGFFGITAWKTYPWLATTAFTAYLGSGAINLFQGINKAGGITKFFKGFFDKGSVLAGGAEQMSLFTSGGGKAGAALGGLATGTAVVGLTAATIGALSALNDKLLANAFAHQYGDNLENLKGTKNQGNTGYASAQTVASSTNSTSGIMQDFGNTGSGFGYLFTQIGTSDKYALNKALTNWMYKGGVLKDSKYAMAWAVLMDQVGSLDALNSVTGGHFTHDSLAKYFKNGTYEDENLWGHINSILKAGWHPYKDNNKGRINTFDDFLSTWQDTYDSKVSIDGYHKAGKEYIPRDNYKALLHKGEMVLNAQEAEYYRNMYPHGGDSDTKPRAKGRIITGLPWPMTAGYPSYPSGGQHRGLDFGIPIGTKVGAAIGGTIVKAYTGDNYNTYKEGRKVFGQYVLMKGNNGLYYRYGHLSKVGVKEGQQVAPGELIGLSGNTGYSTGPHLHFQVQRSTANNSDISPYSYITSALFQTTGNINAGNSTQNSNNAISSGQSTIPIRTTKFIPKALQFATEGGIGGMEESVSKGVNSGIDRLIGYLDGIRSEQNDQRKILEAFSKSRLSESTY